VGAEGHGGKPVREPLEDEGFLAALPVPDPHRPVPGGAGELLAVRAEDRLRDGARVPPEAAEFLAVLRVPDPHLAVEEVPAGRGQALAVRAEGHAPHRAGVPFEGAQLLPGPRLPDLHFPGVIDAVRTWVARGGGQATAVGAESHSGYRAAVPLEDQPQ